MSGVDQLTSLQKEIQDNLIEKTRFTGEIRFDLTTRLLYSTDASIYQIKPLGVVYPRSGDDLVRVMSLAQELEFSILPRGSGSSLAGQAIGPGLILDCSRHLNHILEINPETQIAVVEPGVILNSLNRLAGIHSLQFGPDPASAERATLGGSIANNAAGAHSIIYGLTVDHLLAADVILSDASRATFSAQNHAAAEAQAAGQGVFAEINRTALKIRSTLAGEIRSVWPKTWRRVSGYNLNYLLPWSPSPPPEWEANSGEWMVAGEESLPYPPIKPGEINLASLLAGSEGTLALIERATLRLVPRPRQTALGVLNFPSIAAACDEVPELLSFHPSAVELIPFRLVHLARKVPAYAHQVSFVDEFARYNSESSALLVVEFSGTDLQELRQKVLSLGHDVWLADSAEAQRNVWAVRKVGLGILMSRLGPAKPVAFIEDISVPVDRLGEFVRAVDVILGESGTTSEIYAHASAGCLHIRPILNLKTSQGVMDLRSIASQVISLALSLGGAISGEHGDGLARSEWISQAYGNKIAEAFRQLKTAADPGNLLNPGKIIDPLPMDVQLRYGLNYRAEAWKSVFNYTGQSIEPVSLLDAIEHCNGAGVCRKTEGVMCPSFQASRDEMHSTRGRANLLRLMVSGAFPTQDMAEQSVREALDLCLACKGCKSECPSGVDIAKLKYEFTQQYYGATGRRHPWRDYLFGYIDRFAVLGRALSFLANPFLASRPGHFLLEKVLAISSARSLPMFAPHTLHRKLRSLPPVTQPVETVIFLSDPFTEYFHPTAGLAAVRILQLAGCRVFVLPILGAGRTLISKGFLKAARNHAEQVLTAIKKVDPQGQLPVVGVEPSEIFTLGDEYIDLFPEERFVRDLSQRAWMVDEFLLRPGPDRQPRLDRLKSVLKQAGRKDVLLHGHCYQKARPPAPDGLPVGMAASAAVIRFAGYTVKEIEAGCCGMAGSFGYEKEHAAFSLQVGELVLLPVIRLAPDTTLIAAAGVSCQAQIEDGAARKTYHPIELLNHCLNG